MDNNILLNFDDIKIKYNLTNKEYFKYMQISHFINKTLELNNSETNKIDDTIFNAE